MYRLISFISFIFLLNSFINAQNHVVKCNKFTIDNDNFLKTRLYCDIVETAILHIEYPPLTVVRDNDKLIVLSENIAEEKRMSPFGKNAMLENKILNANYSISCNAIKDLPNDKYTLKLEITRVSGENISQNFSLKSIVFTKKEFEEIDIFEKKLTIALEKEIAFNDKIGLIGRQDFEKLEKDKTNKNNTIDSLKDRINIFEKKELQRQQKEVELDKLKQIAPNVDCNLFLTNEGINIEFDFLNEIPIQYTYFPIINYNFDEKNRKWLNDFGSHPLMIYPKKIYPKKGKKSIKFMPFSDYKLDTNTVYYFYMRFTIKSIYFEEIGTPNLEIVLLKLFEYNQIEKKITFLGNWKDKE